MGRNFLAPFFIRFLLVATVLNFSGIICVYGQAGGLPAPLICQGTELYITAACDACDGLCRRHCLCYLQH
ncbi:hypothetical protein MKW92_043255 [Papaver armeniacum]|nr:hypothetical protein MKW92_043255 [Papaver armeniacum]